MSSDLPVLVEKKQAVGILRLNKESQIHALDSELIACLADQISTLEADPSIRCLLLTNVGKGFVAGASISEMKDLSFPATYLHDFINHDWERLGACRTPVVVLVHGYALGGGCELMMMGDVILASEKSKFGQPEVGLGIPPGIGGTQRLTKAIGKARAMDLCLTGRMMDAAEALSCGLISRILTGENLEEQALEVAHTIAEKPALAAMMTKEAIDQSFEMSLHDGIRFERRLFQASFASEDQKEGMIAFMEKRPPKFQHK